MWAGNAAVPAITTGYVSSVIPTLPPHKKAYTSSAKALCQYILECLSQSQPSKQPQHSRSEYCQQQWQNGALKRNSHISHFCPEAQQKSMHLNGLSCHSSLFLARKRQFPTESTDQILFDMALSCWEK